MSCHCDGAVPSTRQMITTKVYENQSYRQLTLYTITERNKVYTSSLCILTEYFDTCHFIWCFDLFSYRYCIEWINAYIYITGSKADKAKNYKLNEKNRITVLIVFWWLLNTLRWDSDRPLSCPTNFSALYTQTIWSNSTGMFRLVKILADWQYTLSFIQIGSGEL